VKSAISKKVLFENVSNCVLFENCTKRFILSGKAKSEQTIPFLEKKRKKEKVLAFLVVYQEIDRRWWVVWSHTNNRRLDFGGGSEIILPDFHHVGDIGKQSTVCGQPAVQRVTWLCSHPQRKLSLKHQHCGTKEGTLAK
jgi:hypothetical protein